MQQQNEFAISTFIETNKHTTQQIMQKLNKINEFVNKDNMYINEIYELMSATAELSQEMKQEIANFLDDAAGEIEMYKSDLRHLATCIDTLESSAAVYAKNIVSQTSTKKLELVQLSAINISALKSALESSQSETLRLEERIDGVYADAAISTKDEEKIKKIVRRALDQFAPMLLTKKAGTCEHHGKIMNDIDELSKRMGKHEEDVHDIKLSVDNFANEIASQIETIHKHVNNLKQVAGNNSEMTNKIDDINSELAHMRAETAHRMKGVERLINDKAVIRY